MPVDSKVHRLFAALKAKGFKESSAARIAQSKTGLALSTGLPPKHPTKNGLLEVAGEAIAAEHDPLAHLNIPAVRAAENREHSKLMPSPISDNQPPSSGPLDKAEMDLYDAAGAKRTFKLKETVVPMKQATTLNDLEHKNSVCEKCFQEPCVCKNCMKYMKDASGHEHAPAGNSEGGQFTKGSAGNNIKEIKSHALKGLSEKVTQARNKENELQYYIRNPEQWMDTKGKGKTEEDLQKEYTEAQEEYIAYKDRYEELVKGNTSPKEKLEKENLGFLYSHLGTVGVENVDKGLASLEFIGGRLKNGQTKWSHAGAEVTLPKELGALKKTIDMSTQPMKEGTSYESHLVAHELGHIIDRGYKLSSSKEWKEIYDEEIKGTKKDYKLSWYASTDKKEGFCEFGRYLMNGNDVSMYPKAKKYWIDNKLFKE